MLFRSTRTPFFINCVENALNIALALVLAPRSDVLGLGLAFSLAYLASAVVALEVLHRKHGTPRLNALLFARRS